MFGKTALSYIVQFDRDDMLKFLIEAEANLDIGQGGRGNTPLITAIEKNYTRCVKSLLNAGADVNAANKYGVTPIHIHNMANNSDEHNQCLNLLLHKGCIDVNSADSYGNTPLINAAKYCHHDCLTSLLQAGADVNRTNNKGSTALNVAASPKSIDILIDAGADVNIPDNGGMTPVMAAATTHNKESIQKIFNAGADLNAVFKNGNTAAFFAATNDQMMVIKFLYMKGTLINRKNKEDRNAVDFLLERLIHRERLVKTAAGDFVRRHKCSKIFQSVNVI